MRSLSLAAFLLLPSLAQAQEVWRGDFETGDTSQWDGELNGMAGGEDLITIVGDPVIEGASAVRIELTNDAVWPNGLKRVELHHSPDNTRTAAGEDLYFAWSFYLPEALPSDPEATIGYWETDVSYQQLMAFAVIGDDLRFSTNHPSWREVWRGAGVVTPGTWHRIALHVLWSTDEAVGTVDVWFDGEAVVTGAHAQTLVDGNSAFTQLGLLRGAIEFSDRPVILIDDAVEGDSLASVRPDALREAPDAGTGDPDAAISADAGTTSGDTGAPGLDGGRTDAGMAASSGGCSARPGRSGTLALWLLVLALLARRHST